MFEHKVQGAVDVISGDGPLDKTTLEEVKSVVNQCLAHGQPRLVFDLTKVPLFDSGGLEYLLELQDECARRGGIVRLAAPSALCRDILDVCSVSQVMEVCPNVTTAVGGFAQ